MNFNYVHFAKENPNNKLTLHKIYQDKINLFKNDSRTELWIDKQNLLQMHHFFIKISKYHIHGIVLLTFMQHNITKIHYPR